MKRIALFLLIWALCAVPHPALATPVAINAPAPAFSATAADGKTVKLSDYAGKVVVLEWFNKDCPFVRKHYESGNMQKLQANYTAKGVIWLTVSSSGLGRQGYIMPETAQQLYEEKGMKSTALVLDASGEIGKSFGAKTTPHLFVIDQKGALRYSGAIDDTPSTDPDDISSSENYVAEAVDALLAGKEIKTQTTQSYGCSVKYE